MSIQIIQQRIGRVRFRLRALYLSHGLFRILFLIGAFVLANFALDAWLHLPLPVRIALAAAAAIGLVYVAYRYVLFPLFFPISTDDIAKHVEREHPFLEGRLVATLQLSRRVKEPDYADSVSMTEALFRETEGLLDRVDFSSILRPGRVGRMAVFPAAVAALLAGVVLAFPLHARIWFARNVLFQSVSWPRATTVGLVVRSFAIGPETPVPVAFDLGEDAGEVELVLHHRPLAAVDLPWTTTTLEPAGGGRFEGTLPGATADVVFFVQVQPIDRASLAYIPDPDRRSPFYVLSIDPTRPPAVGGEGIRVALPDRELETAAGVYPVWAYVDGEIPRDVTLSGRSESGQPISVKLTQRTVDVRREDGTTETVQTRVFDRGLELAESCRFHLAAGDDDDDRPEYAVRVVVPPKLDQAIVWMEYPEYMGREDRGWTTYQEVSAERDALRAANASPAELESVETRWRSSLLEVQRAERKTYLGSVVHLATRSSQPIREAWLVFDRSPLPREASRVRLEPSGPDRSELAARIDLDKRFDVSPADGGPEPEVRRIEFHLEVVGDSGLSSRRHTTYTLHVVRDKSPEFAEIAPFGPNESRLERVAVAILEFRAKVADDYGLTSVAIEVYTGDDETEPTERVVLLDGDGPPPAAFDLRRTFDLELLERVETTRVGTRRRPLEEGDVVRFRLVATDNRLVERLGLAPQTTTMGFFRVAIISKGKILEQTDKDLSSLKNLILEMRRREQLIRDATAEVLATLATTPEPPQLAKRSLELQNEQTDRITRAAEGIAVSLREVNARFVVNNIESERPVHLLEMLPIMESVATEMSPAAARNLEALGKAADPEARKTAARTALDDESKVIAALDRLLVLLNKWENYYEVVQEARRLRDMQEKINRDTQKTFQD